ncbi:MAG TPA: nuclear transport factor 2 family protein [Burkholderiales bacterium]|jgi:hypothetical protein|nr:nuclear transport factor 2 family protein [Burkholderiales bacterium]
MNQDLTDFEKFMREREAAAGAYVRGDAGPLGRIVAHASSATFFGPGGGIEQGAMQVYARYEADAAQFSEGRSHFEILQIGANDGIAYWVGIQRASARMARTGQPVGMSLRITEIFRREGAAWKLVHRHADTLRDGGTEKP